MKLFYSCQQAHKLIIKQQDVALSPLEKSRLHVHLWLCANCTRFNQQMSVMRDAIKQLSQPD